MSATAAYDRLRKDYYILQCRIDDLEKENAKLRLKVDKLTKELQSGAQVVDVHYNPQDIHDGPPGSQRP